jgi:adenylosuccinate synthase
MPATIVVGAQWGDEGKGKIVDLLAGEHDWVVRYQGGANAGHSVVHEGRTIVLHLVPSGILREGKRCVIGNGVVVDPAALVKELDDLAALGVRAEGRLYLSAHAHLILPYHRLAEREREDGPEAVGTTRRGIGPAYEDKAARAGVRAGDLVDPEALAAGVARVRARAVARLESAADFPEASQVTEETLALGRRIVPLLADTRVLVWDALARGERVLLEGAQGTHLDLDHGTYPYVTSSSAVAGGACTGVGIGPTRITDVIGVAKAYATRVGNGPFPSEVSGELADRLREGGHEYGATTGRPRRCGWFDAVAIRHAVRVNGLTQLVITKLDVLDAMPEIQIVVEYEVGKRRVSEMPESLAELNAARPICESFGGWTEPTTGARQWDDLPREARRYLARLEELAGVPVRLVSVGSGRDENVSRHVNPREKQPVGR